MLAKAISKLIGKPKEIGLIEDHFLRASRDKWTNLFGVLRPILRKVKNIEVYNRRKPSKEHG